MHLHTDTPAAAAPLRVNLAPATAPEDVNPVELDQLLLATRRAYKPGLCIRTIIAGIVAAGSLNGIDFTQERDYAEPLLLAGRSVRVLEFA